MIYILLYVNSMEYTELKLQLHETCCREDPSNLPIGKKKVQKSTHPYIKQR